MNGRYRTIFLSDIHLATRGCKAEFLIDFLRHHDSERLYLVGDIFDGWQMKRSLYWPQSHNDVVQKFLRKVRKGTMVYYLPGNHDEGMRGYAGMQFGGVTVLKDTIHETADGRRLLVLHGDQFDGVVLNARWLSFLGSSAYDLALSINNGFNAVRRRLGFPYWSLSNFLKQKVKRAVEYLTNFQSALIQEARRRELDGVICGHVHNAEIRFADGFLYCNCGDWVENCTAIAEHMDGRLEILHWPRVLKIDTPDPAKNVEEEQVAS